MLGPWGNRSASECCRIIETALDSGINFIDTADAYSDGETEITVGKAIASRRDEVLVATKGGSRMGAGPNSGGSSRLWLTRAVEDSLRRLNVDAIDLYQLHRFDPATDLADTLTTLDNLIQQGKIRYIGCSTLPGWQIIDAHWMSARRRVAHFCCEQPPYSILCRHVERETFPVALRLGMGIVVWSPLAEGWLTGKYLGDELPADSRAVLYADRGGKFEERFDMSREPNQKKKQLVASLAGIAEDAGTPLPHMALAFCLAHPAVTSAIIGPRNLTQLADLVAGSDVRLDGATLDRIDSVVPPGTLVDEADRRETEPWMEREARRSSGTDSGRLWHTGQIPCY